MESLYFQPPAHFDTSDLMMRGIIDQSISSTTRLQGISTETDPANYELEY